MITTLTRPGLMQRLRNPALRYVYVVAQRGSGLTRLLGELAAMRPPASLCVMRSVDRIASSTYAEYAHLLSTPEPPRLLVATATDPAFPHPFTDARPGELCILTDEDLAFTREDIGNLFRLNGLDIPAGSTQRIFELTGGWTGGAAHALRVWSAEGETVACDPSARAYREMRAYVYEHVLSHLSPDELAVLVTAVAINDPNADVLRSALPVCNVEVALAGLLARRLMLRDNGHLVVTGLVEAAVREHYRGDFQKLSLSIAAELAQSGNFFSAARIALSVGDGVSVVEYLLLMRFEELLSNGDRFDRILRALPEAVVCAHPKLWVRAIHWRRYTVDLNVMLMEAQMLIEAFDGVEEPDVMRLVRSVLYVGLCEAGEFERAQTVLPSLEAPAGGRGGDRLIEAMVAGNVATALSYTGKDEQAAKHLQAAAPLLSISPGLRGLFMHIHVRKARVEGDWFAERVFVERAVEAATQGGDPCAVAMALFHGAFGAVVAGDRPSLASYMERLRELGDDPDVSPFAGLADGSTPVADAPVRFGLPRMRAAAYVIQAAHSGSPQAAREYLTAAIEQFDASGYIYGRIVSRVALAQVLPARQAELLGQAKQLALDLKCQALSGALSRLSIGELPLAHQPLRRMAEELRRLRAPVSEPVVLDLLCGCVRRHGRPIDVSQRVLLLLAALQVRRRPVDREELCEMLWTGEDPTGAANALKMTVRRARVQCGDPQIVEYKNNLYSLGPHVQIEVDRVRYACEAALRETARSARERSDLQETYRLLSAGRPTYLLDNEWFAGTEAMLVNLQMQLGEALAREVMEREQYASAPDLARMMLECDPCDETAWELLIRTHLANGDREAATRTFREYWRSVATQLQAAPSQRLEKLLA